MNGVDINPPRYYGSFMLKAMDPTLLCQLVQGETDTLSKAAEADAAIYHNARCPVCYQTGCTKKLLPPKIVEGPNGPSVVRSPFGAGPIAEGVAHCQHCDTDFDPRTGLILHTAASLIRGLRSDPLPE